MTVLAIDSGMSGGVAHKLTKFAETGPFSDGREGEWRNAREDQKKRPRVTAPTTSGRFRRTTDMNKVASGNKIVVRDPNRKWGALVSSRRFVMTA